MLSAALTRALTIPAFLAAGFAPTQWDSADQKAKFANMLMKFIVEDFPRSKFHEKLYQRLSSTFGHIAWYNRDGFYQQFFLTAEGKRSLCSNRRREIALAADAARAPPALTGCSRQTRRNLAPVASRWTHRGADRTNA